MASKKDMRRPDLVVPYVEPQDDNSAADMMGSMSSTLPMAAIFTRNKMIGWVALVIALQAWLAETATQRAKSSTPSIFQVGMALMSLGVCYMQMFMPPPPIRPVSGGSGTDAPPAVPA